MTAERVARVLARLDALVSIETPTGDIDGIRGAQDLVCSWLDPIMGVAGERETVEGVTHLTWRGSDESSVLLLGHIDTVFPRGTLAERPFRVDGDRATGPGVFDMKSGIVIMAEALALTKRSGAVSVLLTSDEEIGSITSRALVEREAKQAGTVLVLEPSLDGALKVARRGGGIYRVDVHGRAAHAGLEPHVGRSALMELAHQVLAISALEDDERGTSVNPTVAHAGTATNVIPERGFVNVDVRAWTTSELERVDAAINALQVHTLDVRIETSGGINRPPMEDDASRELLEIACAVGARLGLPPLGAVSAGGASDGNFTAAIGARTLDGLGPCGGGAHGVDEWVSVESIIERIDLIAGLLDDLTRSE